MWAIRLFGMSFWHSYSQPIVCSTPVRNPQAPGHLEMLAGVWKRKWTSVCADKSVIGGGHLAQVSLLKAHVMMWSVMPLSASSVSQPLARQGIFNIRKISQKPPNENVTKDYYSIIIVFWNNDEPFSLYSHIYFVCERPDLFFCVNGNGCSLWMFTYSLHTLSHGRAFNCFAYHRTLLTWINEQRYLICSNWIIFGPIG